MTVKIIRKNERLTAEWTELEVYVDGKKKTSVFGDGSTEVELEGETAELKVKQIMNRAVTRQVKAGDTVEVSNSRAVTRAVPLLPLMLLILFAFSYFGLFNFGMAGVLVIGFIIFLTGVKPLQIKVIGSGQESGS
ncbi:hypothetical protein [Lacicoccus alkaliphilus]|uniref:Uncharacterized protein n=1 Tax=Lacicoccus alkaliphilus DSM 16010 TaxID=1123231 RepID=A0A1M7IXB1_9BACL|nr:hypothetical protein [Salinicoccus alkaliphilus]SHM45386.1 hypothetical protein SAMN02745189_02189 [Salinicoccus alkaliphilus DSM 16010]